MADCTHAESFPKAGIGRYLWRCGDRLRKQPGIHPVGQFLPFAFPAQQTFGGPVRSETSRTGWECSSAVSHCIWEPA